MILIYLCAETAIKITSNTCFNSWIKITSNTCLAWSYRQVFWPDIACLKFFVFFQAQLAELSFPSNNQEVSLPFDRYFFADCFKWLPLFSS